MIQFVAQELVDDGLVFAVDFEKSARVPRGAMPLTGHGLAIGAEEVAYGVGGVAVLADEGFQ